MSKTQSSKPRRETQRPPQHSTAQQNDYEREARLQYGADTVNASIQRWNSYGKARQDEIMAEGRQIYTALAEAMQRERLSGVQDVTGLIERWHNHIRYFYEPTLEILRGLGELYNIDPAFRAFFEAIHPDLPPYLQEKIAQYVDDLETAELERMLAADEAKVRRLSL